MLKKEKKFIEHLRQSCLKTIRENNLISNGDKILIGISGGKDSLILADILSSIKKYCQIEFELLACHIKVKDVPYEINHEFLKEFCSERGIEFLYVVKEYENKDIDKSPCYFCSWTRRKQFFEISKKHSCNKLATGHHMDDAIETLFMNMIYHGSTSSLPYSFKMFEGRLEFIRPMLDIPEQKLMDYAEIKSYKKLKTECPFDNTSKRKETRGFIEQICNDFPQARINLYNSMKRIKPEYLPISKSE